jgi:hypothetical protein
MLSCKELLACEGILFQPLSFSASLSHNILEKNAKIPSPDSFIYPLQAPVFSSVK